MTLDTSDVILWKLTFMNGQSPSHCYLRGPEHSITVLEYCDGTLETSPILFVNYVFGLLLVLRLMLNFQSSISESKERPKLIIPKHMAVMFTNRNAQIFLPCLLDIIIYSAFYGVERLTFFDPWMILTSRKFEIIGYLRKIFESRPLSKKVVFDGETGYDENQLQVSFLGPRDGRESLVRACKELSHSEKEISIAVVNEWMASSNIYDPDFLIKVGSLQSLAGFSPWNFACTELLTISRFQTGDRVQESEFRQFLESYSQRDRRLGK